MSALLDELAAKLKQKGIRPSYQRLKVLEYLATHRTHPTVNHIYHDLRQNLPTLSRATVYNNLHVLVEAGLVRVVSIEENEAHYDFNTADHGHFKCDSCGNIYDFEIKSDQLGAEGLKGFKITRRDVYFKGICPLCRGTAGNNPRSS